MSEPIRKIQTALALGQELLSEALPDWHNQPRAALALALEKAHGDAAADAVLAAACAVVGAASRAMREAGKQSEGAALFEAQLEVEGLSRELTDFHLRQCSRWEQRA
ncbi:MAG: hypothetical protein LC110_00420 [Burkholderiales bacterium]|nr:hypothetical protein [Burkholderiales bacterium]